MAGGSRTPGHGQCLDALGHAVDLDERQIATHFLGQHPAVNVVLGARLFQVGLAFGQKLAPLVDGKEH